MGNKKSWIGFRIFWPIDFRSRCLSTLKVPSKGNAPGDFPSALRDDVIKMLISVINPPALTFAEQSSSLRNRGTRWPQESDGLPSNTS